MATPWLLLVTPWHGEYPCDTHDWIRNPAELIRLLPVADRKKQHVKTWFDGFGRSGWSWVTLTHASLFGFHRYETVLVEEGEAGMADGVEAGAEDGKIVNRAVFEIVWLFPGALRRGH